MACVMTGCFASEPDVQPTCSDLREAFVEECGDVSDALEECGDGTECNDELEAFNACMADQGEAMASDPDVSAQDLRAAHGLAYWCDLHTSADSCDLGIEQASEVGVTSCPLPERL